MLLKKWEKRTAETIKTYWSTRECRIENLEVNLRKKMDLKLYSKKIKAWRDDETADNSTIIFSQKSNDMFIKAPENCHISN